MPTRFHSGPYDGSAPMTSIKTLHETIMAKLGEQLRKPLHAGGAIAA